MKEIKLTILYFLLMVSQSSCLTTYKLVVPGYYNYKVFPSKNNNNTISTSWSFGDMTSFLQGRLASAIFVEHHLTKIGCLNVTSIHFAAISETKNGTRQYRLVEMDSPYNTGSDIHHVREVQSSFKNDTLYLSNNEEWVLLNIDQNFFKHRGERYPKNLKLITSVSYKECGSNEIKVVVDTSLLVREKYHIFDL